MNFEVKGDSDIRRDRKKPLVVNLIDDQDTTFTSSSSKTSFYREISSGYKESFGQHDPMGQIMGYETVIAHDFKLYTVLTWLSFVFSVALIILYFAKHEGFWMAIMCILEAFCIYTWLIGTEAKKKLKAEIQHSFLSCLFVVIIIKAAMSILGLYSILTWQEDEPEEVNSDAAVQSRLRSLDFTVVLSLFQLIMAGYVYYAGRKMHDLLVKRKNIMGDTESGSNDLAIL